MAPTMTPERPIEVFTRSPTKLRTDMMKIIALKIATYSAVKINLRQTIDTPTFREQSKRAYTRSCMTTSIAHRLTAPTTRMIGSIATQLSWRNCEIACCTEKPRTSVQWKRCDTRRCKSMDLYRVERQEKYGVIANLGIVSLSYSSLKL